MKLKRVDSEPVDKIEYSERWEDYFRIYDWEKSGKIYERFGVKKYRTAWKFVMKISALVAAKDAMKDYKNYSPQELHEKTKQLEHSHLTDMQFMLLIPIALLKWLSIQHPDIDGNVFDWVAVVSVLISEIIILSPIPLLRYTRTKVERILKLMEDDNSDGQVNKVAA